jgi:hypothetical protein
MGSTVDLEANPRMKALYETKKCKWTRYVIGDRELVLAWYDVREYEFLIANKLMRGADLRRGKLQNYVLLYPSEDVPLSSKGESIARHLFCFIQLTNIQEQRKKKSRNVF